MESKLGDLELPNGFQVDNVVDSVSPQTAPRLIENNTASNEVIDDALIVQDFVDKLIEKTLATETLHNSIAAHRQDFLDNVEIASASQDPEKSLEELATTVVLGTPSHDVISSMRHTISKEEYPSANGPSTISNMNEEITQYEESETNQLDDCVDMVIKSVEPNTATSCVLELTGERQMSETPSSGITVLRPVEETKSYPEMAQIFHPQVDTFKNIRDSPSVSGDQLPTPEVSQSVSRASPTHASTDDDKLSKFKALAVKLKKDLARSRSELQATNEKLVDLNDKLDIAEKENSKITLLYSQQVRNFNSLQAEYDRILDDYETIKKKFRLHAQLKSDEGLKDLKIQLDKKSNTIFDLESKLADMKLQVEQKDQLKSKLRDMTETIQSTEKKYHAALRDLEILRSEHSKVSADSNSFKDECEQLSDKLSTLNQALDAERNNHEKLRASFETKVQSLRQQLKLSEDDLHSLNLEFENYKLKVSQLMQESNLVPANSTRTFEQEKLKQLKTSNDNFKKQILHLEQELKEATLSRKEMEEKVLELNKFIEYKDNALKEIVQLEGNLNRIQEENLKLKETIEQYNGMIAPKHPFDSLKYDDTTGFASSSKDQLCTKNDFPATTNHNGLSISSDNLNSSNIELNQTDDLPESSSRDDFPNKFGRHNEMLYTNVGLPFKGAPVEILGGKSSILNDAHVQIDYLTQAYLESEKTNKLLSDQVTALKEEIRRIQRGHERLDLADNLEYLKNIVIKFVSLEGQVEKQRLIPVLSEMLKLSPEEQNKLLSATQSHEKSSFFRIM